ncbi:Detected protein of confused Function [Hibiscus syriacus]|uniref:Detected protein of confused Function n=1 Tax=Hibiscus syriacus TaxID=106335 RepID=A0A6A3ACF9_HIBSY|nr:Detected protein of confused Function [Hibiscus syriacus]
MLDNLLLSSTSFLMEKPFSDSAILLSSELWFITGVTPCQVQITREDVQSLHCLARNSSLPSARPTIASTSKVTPQPSFQNSAGMSGPPRLVRSRAVRRDIVRDWNFEETVMER